MVDLPDVQECDKPIFEIPIKKVGVTNIRLPFKLNLRSGGNIDMVSDTSIYTNLCKSKKGISMSRLLISIQPYLNNGLNSQIIKKCLDEICNAIVADNSYLKFEFELPILKKSPISDYIFPLYYKCSFEGIKEQDKYQFIQTVNIQYSSYCPCSAALSKDLLKTNSNQGFPHAQRSFTKVKILKEINENDKNIIWLEDIIDMVIDNIKTQPYPIIKRIDEQEIARIASENPLFVEDAIRIISYNLDKMDGITQWAVKCVHEESIHEHEAIAMNSSSSLINI